MVDVEVLRNVQQRLSRYIYAKGFLSWNGIRKDCNRIILALPENEQENFKNNAASSNINILSNHIACTHIKYSLMSMNTSKTNFWQYCPKRIFL